MTEQVWVQIVEVFSPEELAGVLNGIWSEGLHVVKIEPVVTEFFQSWYVLYGSKAAYDALHNGFEVHKGRNVLKPKKS